MNLNDIIEIINSKIDCLDCPDKDYGCDKDCSSYVGYQIKHEILNKILNETKIDPV